MKHDTPCLLATLLTVLLLLTACRETVVPSQTRDEWPPIFPDYAGVTIPATIAPLNFRVEGSGHAKTDARIEGSRSGSLHVQSGGALRIPPKAWKQLLADNTGGDLRVTVSVKQAGEWVQYKPFIIHISPHPVDYGLVYRLIAPGYEVYSKMGIYQRNLSDFTQTALLENTLMPGNCMNCHAFCAGDPRRMNLHIRGTYGSTLLMADGQTALYNTKTEQTIGNCVYPYWHPSGRYIAYSVNETRQVFHEHKDKRVEVVDAQSDMVVYSLETNELLSCPQLSSKDAFETFPAFSPDGRTLYFCSAQAQTIPEAYDKVKYSLCRIAFDPETGAFAGAVDTLISAAATNRSVSFPRPSYDGKYLMYALSDYGNFSIWHKEADLWLLDLATNEARAISEVNSDEVESYHSWSSNSRWFVFSSRRIDGLYTRPYLASIDEAGNVGKPFLLPQEAPGLYDSSLYSFNIPEFVTGRVALDSREVEKKARSGERVQMHSRHFK
jgi:Tol biopolymer transport system component